MPTQPLFQTVVASSCMTTAMQARHRTDFDPLAGAGAEVEALSEALSPQQSKLFLYSPSLRQPLSDHF